MISRVPEAYSGGIWGLGPPPRTSEIYEFQGVFRPQRMLNPHSPLERKKIKPRPPWTNS